MRKKKMNNKYFDYVIMFNFFMKEYYETINSF